MGDEQEHLWQGLGALGGTGKDWEHLQQVVGALEGIGS
ncbi:hypothetical protein BN1843_28290 [Escherichia coli]|nr:hypothetical protein BN1843_28290 [Escherichia coli]